MLTRRNTVPTTRTVKLIHALDNDSAQCHTQTQKPQKNTNRPPWKRPQHFIPLVAILLVVATTYLVLAFTISEPAEELIEILNATNSHNLFDTLGQNKSLISKLSSNNNATLFQTKRVKTHKPKRMRTAADMHQFFDELELGWSSPPTDWMIDLCSDVVDHYTRFPVAKAIDPKDLNNLPILPTELAVQSVCTMKILRNIAASMNSHVYLHAGSHLGAVTNGQPIPWDDDVDMFFDFRKGIDLLNICGGNGTVVHSNTGVRLKCHKAPNAIKVWLEHNGTKKYTRAKAQWISPYVDLFFYNVVGDEIWEVSPRGKKYQSFELADYFPTRPYYFGGAYFFGPQSLITENRYKLDICKLGNFNHLQETYVHRHGHRFQSIENLDCNQLKVKFAFRDPEKDILYTTGGSDIQPVYPWKAASIEVITGMNISVEKRQEWFNQTDEMGQNLTTSIANLDSVEVDNSIAPNATCKGPLKVVEMNIERGRWWMEAASMIPEMYRADVIILNEMDIGMGRSDNQHTTRLMAHFLKMNYAWGLEFVELTPGNAEDRDNANSIPDFQGLHGNAFLTRCKISDAIIFRNKIGQYFSSTRNGVNAGGREKRLGGRMGMFGNIIVDGKEVVIGSIHKITGYTDEIKKYIGDRGAIVGGDQSHTYCKHIGLRMVGSMQHHTWPASCKSFGRHRGDNLCSNLSELEKEFVTMPCVNNYGFSTKIGDHALTSVVLGDPIIKIPKFYPNNWHIEHAMRSLGRPRGYSNKKMRVTSARAHFDKYVVELLDT